MLGIKKNESALYRVMIVEDEKFVRSGLKNMIPWSSLGMEVVIDAKNGKEAYEYYFQYKPEIILTDLRMPLMGGIELIKKIRDKDKLTKFIVITCLDEFALVQEALELGVSSYILKHSSGVEEIVSKLKKVYGELRSTERGGEQIETKYSQYAHPRLAATINYIYENYCNNITLQDAADYVGVTPNYLGRLFVLHGDKTFTETLNNIRIEKAKELLSNITLPIYAIADKVGFSNSTYFIRVFKRMTGLTPYEYRIGEDIK